MKRIPACQKLYVLPVARAFISRESHNTDKAILWGIPASQVQATVRVSRRLDGRKHRTGNTVVQKQKGQWELRSIQQKWQKEKRPHERPLHGYFQIS